MNYPNQSAIWLPVVLPGVTHLIRPQVVQGSAGHVRSLIVIPQIAKFMGPTWCPPGACRPQMGPLLAPWTLISGPLHFSLCADWWLIHVRCMDLPQHVNISECERTRYSLGDLTYWVNEHDHPLRYRRNISLHLRCKAVCFICLNFLLKVSNWENGNEKNTVIPTYKLWSIKIYRW